MKPHWYHNVEHVMAVSLLLSWLLIFFVQRRYIMKRYEEETELSKLVFFSNPIFDSFFSGAFFRHLFAGFYTLHLFTVWLMPDSLRRRLPTYRDVADRDQVLRHFSKGELVLSVVIGFMMLVGMTMVCVLLVAKVGLKLVGQGR
jgi:hypothetical protein